MMNIPGKIPISIAPFFWLLAGAIGWLNTFDVVGTIIWMGVIFISVLFHEYGHALTALLFGQRARIELVAFGGMTYRQGPKLSWWKEFLIVLNGPCFGLILFAISVQLWRWMGEERSLVLFAVEIAVAVNFFWSILNLLPVLPLDGGRLMSILLEAVMGVRGVKVSMLISMVLATLIGLLFFILRAILPGALFFLLAFEGYRGWRAAQPLVQEDQDEGLQKSLDEGQRYLRMGQREQALHHLQEIREKAGKGLLYRQATQLLAGLFAEEGRTAEAYDLLIPLKDELEGEDLSLFHQLAYNTGHWETAVEVGSRAYQAIPRYDTALLNALSYALLGQARPSIGWLQCALREGLQDVHEVITRTEFEKVRNDPFFQAFIKDLRASN